MIRHVVAFRFVAQDDAGRIRDAARLRAVLEPLQGAIPGVLSLELGFDDGAIVGHWDAVLVTEHESKEALASYQVHPEHQAALAVVKTLVAEKAVVDYEMGA